MLERQRDLTVEQSRQSTSERSDDAGERQHDRDEADEAKGGEDDKRALDRAPAHLKGRKARMDGPASSVSPGAANGGGDARRCRRAAAVAHVDEAEKQQPLR